MTTPSPTPPPTPAPTVLVGVDGSDGADAAARAAAEAAAARGATLCVLRVVDWPEAGIAGLPPDLDGRSATRAAAELQVRWLVARLAQWLPADRITGEVVDGDPVHVLRASSQDLDLLVVGAHGQAWSSGETLGSVAAGVVRGASCPVLVHRHEPALGEPHRGVVVGIDGGPGSAQLLDAAAAEARLRATTLKVLHTWPQLTEDAGTPVKWRLDPATTTTAEQAVVAELVSALRLRSDVPAVDAAVVGGRAGKVLVWASHTAELVVVGRPELSPDHEMRATTRQVSQRAGCPVLVVPLATTADVPVPA